MEGQSDKKRSVRKKGHVKKRQRETRECKMGRDSLPKRKIREERKYNK
jgi:hypothetical protein